LEREQLRGSVIELFKNSALLDADAAFRALPCLWKPFERNTGGDILARVSPCGVVDIRTFQADKPDRSLIGRHFVFFSVNLRKSGIADIRTLLFRQMIPAW
jgi:hypothetical protein